MKKDIKKGLLRALGWGNKEGEHERLESSDV